MTSWRCPWRRSVVVVVVVVLVLVHIAAARELSRPTERTTLKLEDAGTRHYGIKPTIQGKPAGEGARIMHR